MHYNFHHLINFSNDLKVMIAGITKLKTVEFFSRVHECMSSKVGIESKMSKNDEKCIT